MPETQVKSLLIDNTKCITCSICVSLCPHDALTIVDRVPEVTGKCRVCGLCASSCPPKAITMAAKKFRDESLAEEIDGDIVVFSCRRIKSTADACVISLLCSARIDISLIADAFMKGAKCVIVSTCGKNCRNYPGSEEAKSKVNAFKKILKAIGESKDRILLVEGDFAKAVESVKGKFTEKVEKADLLKSITLNRDLRALIAKMRSITEEGNAYGEKIPREKVRKNP
uniref:Hydrogenase iron-sulfur subunit n=1 Tax=Geoglobus ahangari TaxID=113653 RepID=A0A7J3TIY0_9EURY